MGVRHIRGNEFVVECGNKYQVIHYNWWERLLGIPLERKVQRAYRRLSRRVERERRYHELSEGISRHL
ncbi:hypothetical protein [Alicyclobacillus shizuokensis]|uniref:hypothetical protein n=1 Tax=Alicyclobacillus shizuokensis TaxID=392014 RepID=UPI000A6376D0|nr:hypothetical protein [Alicyclobacillus shizuokensis]